MSRKSAEEVAEFIEVEETKAGVSAAKVATDKLAEDAMGESDEAQDQRNMDAFDKCNQTGVASQFVAEPTESAQAFFGLGNKVMIALKGAEAHGIVDVGDGDMVGF